MERLEDLAFFAEVVERGGFAAAARVLGLGRSKLSRRIAELEQRLGVRLLQRNTRRVSLTPAGERVYEHARVLAHAAREALNVASELNGQPRGSLRIACSSTFAAHALVPILTPFCKKHPCLRVAIIASDQLTDLILERIDLAFRVSSAGLDDSSLVMRPVSSLPIVLAAHPDLIARTGPLSAPDQLEALAFITLGTHTVPKTLTFSTPDGQHASINCTPSFVCNNMSVLQSAVASGLGAAMLPRYLCEDAIAAGTLVDVLASDSGWMPAPSSVHALMPARQGISLTTRTFLEYSTPLLQQLLSGKR
ncbi:LysR substrate-binding domain-containing protein [Burkholderia ambifaria]|jgi:DNA-binding transcriptional LysR family regulator|uniref:LysR substrate-binding domain-containing protein n=1 Tax=Burkholderia ambifaria TaxID=152480 RepID=UPI00158DC7D1|nr:LysR substrate-binding domain-containing protein [Burkholderia ambifaria]